MTTAADLIARGDRSARTAIAHAVTTGALMAVWEVWSIDDLPGWESGFGRSRPSRRLYSTRETAVAAIARDIVGAFRESWRRCVESGLEQDAHFCDRMRDDLLEAERDLEAGRPEAAILVVGGEAADLDREDKVAFQRGRAHWSARPVAVRRDPRPAPGRRQRGSRKADDLARRISRGDDSAATAAAYLRALDAWPRSAWMLEIEDRAGVLVDTFLSDEAALDAAAHAIMLLVDQFVDPLPRLQQRHPAVQRSAAEAAVIVHSFRSDFENGFHDLVLRRWEETPLVDVQVRLVRKEIDP